MNRYRRLFELQDDSVLVAPDGFLSRRYDKAIREDKVRVIEIRNLSDGPVFLRVFHNSNQA